MKTQEVPRIHLTGAFTALVTPFTEKGEVDEPALRKLVRRQVAGGVAGVVPGGTTGEAVTLEPDEHERVVAVTVEEARAARRPIRVIAGCGSNDTRRSQKLAERCRRAGADALLVVTPYYNKPTPRGLIEHFRAVADAGHLPVVAYNVPARTGVNMLPETVLQLAEDSRTCAVKEASGNLDQACEILRHRPAGFSVLSGEDSLALPMIACGADGVIAVVSNEAPALLVAPAEAALDDGDIDRGTEAEHIDDHDDAGKRGQGSQSGLAPIESCIERFLAVNRGHCDSYRDAPASLFAILNAGASRFVRSLSSISQAWSCAW